MYYVNRKYGSFLFGFLVCVMSATSSQQAVASSFFDSGKIYTFFGFTFCFPACPYESAAVPFPRYPVVERPMPR